MSLVHFAFLFANCGIAGCKGKTNVQIITTKKDSPLQIYSNNKPEQQKINCLSVASIQLLLCSQAFVKQMKKTKAMWEALVVTMETMRGAR